MLFVFVAAFTVLFVDGRFSVLLKHMPRTFHYFVGKTSWGIAIFLTATAYRAAGNLDSAKEIDTAVWLVVEDKQLTSEEHDFLSLGLHLVAGNIRRYSMINLPVVIHVINVEFGLCDYQPEGLVGAIAGWAAAEFGFPPLEIPVEFDRGENRYIFYLPDAGLC